jgi:integrase
VNGTEYHRTPTIKRGYKSGIYRQDWERARTPWDGSSADSLSATRFSAHAALPWREIGAFMGVLRQQEGVGRVALEFAILTAERAGEVIGARWSEIDINGAIWTIPP